MKGLHCFRFFARTDRRAQCFGLKELNLHLRNDVHTADEKSTVRLASVGLAQARPNNRYSSSGVDLYHTHQASNALLVETTRITLPFCSKHSDPILITSSCVSKIPGSSCLHKFNICVQDIVGTLERSARVAW